MPGRNPNLLYTKLQGHISNIDKTRQKAESLFGSDHIVLRDLNLIYRGLFLDFVTSVENFIEELFTGLLTGKYVHPAKTIQAKQLFTNAKICRDIISGDRKYSDWLPYDTNTIKRAKKYFKKGYPFARLNNNEKRIFEKILIIRNVLAHDSPYSKKRFNEVIISNQNLLSHEKTVIGFLRTPIGAGIPQNRYEILTYETMFTLRKIISRRVR